MTIATLIENITHPQALESFYDATKKLRIILHRTSEDAGHNIQLPQEILEAKPKKSPPTTYFPFMSIYDLKLAIYKHLKEEGIATDVKTYPEYQFLSMNIDGQFSAVDFKWFIPASKNPIALATPFDLEVAKKTAVNFVDENGTLRNLVFTDTSKLLIESLKTTELHLYLYDDMKKEIPPEDELSWNVYLHPYFPDLSYSVDTIKAKKQLR